MANKNFQSLKVEDHGRIAHVILNRAEKRNAFDPVMIEELKVAFTTIGQRDDIAAVYLRGEGVTFSAGADLGYMKSMASFSLKENEADAQTLDDMFWAMRSCPQPVVGRIHGHAMGGALGLTALCDIVGAVSDTQFCFSEVKLGLAPAVISPYILEKMQISQAKRYMLSGEIFSAGDALNAGLVHFVGDSKSVDEFIEKILVTLSANGPEAMRETKKLIRLVEKTIDWDDLHIMTTKAIAARRVSEEGQEGLRGFLEKTRSELAHEGAGNNDMTSFQSSIQKIAIANRGEVAVRIIHACRELGIQTVLLHSEVDIGTRAWRMADEKICIGAAATSESYLRIDRNVAGAVSSGAQAVHPGFGFLSENADFAQACVDAGLIFIGPKAATIRALGDKISAKKLIDQAGVPTVPGYNGDDQRLENLVAQAERIGFPVIVKAAAGGGGRGMKVIRSRAEASELILSAQREAQSAFGSAIVFLEKYLDHAKHIEFQVFGDFTGRCVHLFERECTVQRRHQKIIEEATAPSLDSDLRAQMAKAAVTLAEKASYQGAGTVEFLLQDGKFYFLEMNTRLQVEHPVTELVLGVDLVKAQILTAAKEFVLWKQASLIPRGHAIECRVYAEDPYREGMPSTGRLVGLCWPEGPGRRFEVGFEAGDEITSFYDPMIAKLIVWDEDRPRAIRKMLKVIDESIIFGVHANLPYLKAILSHPEFVDGTMTTQFIQKNFPNALTAPELTEKQKLFIEAARAQMAQTRSNAAGLSLDPAAALMTPWQGAWRSV